jgi:hypothetical protein
MPKKTIPINFIGASPKQTGDITRNKKIVTPPPAFTAEVEVWPKRQPDSPSRSEALRRLVAGTKVEADLIHARKSGDTCSATP